MDLLRSAMEDKHLLRTAFASMDLLRIAMEANLLLRRYLFMVCLTSEIPVG